MSAVENQRTAGSVLLAGYYPAKISQYGLRCHISGYLENERRYSLTGPDGCYNKFEEERRQGIIIDQLANISRQLDQIRRNQERLTDALDDIQRNTNYLCITLQQTNAKLEAIQQDTRTAAWCSQQAAADQRAIKSYIVMRDWLNI
ncbi:MAG: hypothetical protein ACLSHU_05375 [Oscillospiraceae bacterium]